MSRTSWNIYIKNSANSYDADGTIYRPNEDLEEALSSTHQKIRLADGTNAFVVPETSSSKEPLTFVWRGIVTGDNLISKIEGYIDNDEELKITTHLSVDYIGRFLNIRKTHAVGQSDIWDVEAIFDRK